MMTNIRINSQNSDDDLNRYRLELSEILLRDEIVYPWNPYGTEAEDFFQEKEQQFPWAESLDNQEMQVKAEDFFASLEQCWSSVTESKVKQSLSQRFGELVPSDWLEAIAQRIEELSSVNLNPLEELIQCVQPLLTGWQEEDLQVFARPLVYAMRSQKNQGIESTIKSLEKTPWEQLSEIERVRLSMAIANYALSELKKDNLS